MFNSLSLGRSRNNQSATPAEVKAPSHETLAAHPLLGSSAAAASNAPLNDAPLAVDDLTRPPGRQELPYKPRQRHSSGGGSMSGTSMTSIPPTNTGTTSGPQPMPTLNVVPPTKTTQPSAVTTASPAFASSNPLPPGPPGASLTSRLQLQSLKAAGQRMRLGNASTGMQMLETLFEKAQISRSASGGGDWGEILRVITAGKATLLLPRSSASSLPITAQVLRDHVIFTCPTTAASESVFVTMSGLVGIVEQDKITFESCVPPIHPLVQALKDPRMVSTALTSLQPLRPHTRAKSSYPNVATDVRSGVLPFPPLPPPPSVKSAGGTRSRSGSGASLTSLQPMAAASRLNPFSSFFGGGSKDTNSSKDPNGPPQTPPRGTRASSSSGLPHDAVDLSTSPRVRQLASSPSSVASLTPSEQPPNTTQSPTLESEGFLIPAWSIEKAISQTDICKSLSKAVQRTISDQLDQLPDKFIDRVVRFVRTTHPGLTDAKTGPTTPLLGSAQPTIHDAPLDLSPSTRPDVISEQFQTFLENIYDDLFTYYMSVNPLLHPIKRKASITKKQGLPAGGVASEGVNEHGGEDLTASIDSTKSPTMRPHVHEKDKLAVEDVSKRTTTQMAAEDAAERQAVVGVNLIEKAITCLLYNL